MKLKVDESNNPLSVNLSCGITGNAMKASVMNGEWSVQPIFLTSESKRRFFSTTSSTPMGDMIPAIGRLSESVAVPSVATMPPLIATT